MKAVVRVLKAIYETIIEAREMEAKARAHQYLNRR